MSRWICTDDIGSMETRTDQEMIDSAPTIDIVRCGECKHCDTGIDEDGNKFWKCLGIHYGGVNPDDFCSYGEREGE